MLTVQVHNVALTGQAALTQGAQGLEEERGQLQASLQATLQKFETVEAEASIVEAEVIDNVSSCCQQLSLRRSAAPKPTLDYFHLAWPAPLALTAHPKAKDHS